ncbi:SMI1/KNR4 family protein [Citrobacter sp. S2-9]|uniref:SMI1/KNR4 family protein n=1 Tax=Citrobacter enshiensis TaxID=2971264 RepID=A0ABT8Q177_9ENTR|nr:SMI1/KNR4 family protein [Citrobacter enshiensis]MDN8602304.1 SMI1/KNR4 family protein [Citrobacter enshiensis]
MTLQNSFTNIRLEQSAPETSESLIKLIITEDFPGKDYFINFYLKNNGGYLPSPTSHYYRDSFYNISLNERNAMHVEGFYFIPQHPEEYKCRMLLSIPRVRWHYSNHSEQARVFSATHIPFAFDASGNVYWINTKNGVIQFINHEKENEPVDNIAPSFRDFCENIKSTRRLK